MRIEDRVDDVDARLKRVAAEVHGLMEMPGIYGAEYGKIRTALEGWLAVAESALDSAILRCIIAT